jgi:hypothetical protein
MSFQPVVPTGGYAGWRFLQRTLPQQQAALSNSASALRDEAYFREKIGKIDTAEQLVGDRRLLRVALTAFGLQDDIANRAYLQKVLESRISDNNSFANRLADKRYRQLAQAFAFADRTVPRTKLVTFPDEILARFRDRNFEIAVGRSDDTMRVALALQRDLKTLAGQPSTDLTRWYTVLGTPNLRTVFEKAFNLPVSFGTLDIDRQVDILKERTERLTGEDTISQFADAKALETLTQRYFLGVEIAQIRSAGTLNPALTLLQSGQASLSALLRR